MECQKMKAFAYLVFPNSAISIIPEGSSHMEGELMEHGIITSVTHGVMSGSFHTILFLTVTCLHQTTFYHGIIIVGVFMISEVVTNRD